MQSATKTKWITEPLRGAVCLWATPSNLLSVCRPEFLPALLPLCPGQGDRVNHGLILLCLSSDGMVNALHRSSTYP